MRLIIDISEEDYKFIKSLHSMIIGGRGNCKSIQKNVINAIRNGTLLDESAPQGEWITIGAGKDLLIDHHWYLIVHKDFKTPMKAIYHSDGPHFTFFYEGGEGCSYLFEDKITCFRELPEMPE